MRVFKVSGDMEARVFLLADMFLQAAEIGEELAEQERQKEQLVRDRQRASVFADFIEEMPESGSEDEGQKLL